MEKIPKIVLKALRTPPPESHPDADLLTAFAEHSLIGRERDDVMEHLACCADCRQVVALALPESEALEARGFASEPRRGWLRWPVLRWGLVAAGIVAVASVAIMQYSRREPKLVATNRTYTESLPVSAPAPAASVPQESAPQSSEGKAAQPGGHEVPAARSEAAKANPETAAAMPQAQHVPLAGSTVSSRGYSAQRVGPSSLGGYAGGLPAAGSHAARATSAPGEASQAVTEATGEEPGDQAAVAKAKPAQKEVLTMAPAPMLRTDPGLMKNRTMLRWTISAGGALQRSQDGGATWQDVNVVADELNPAHQMRAAKNVTVEVSGAAPTIESTSKAAATPKMKAANAPATATASAGTIFRAVSVSSDATEVWAGGAGAALFHTVDAGDHWVRVVPSDAGVALTGDVVGIQFTDPQNGAVTTANGEVWSTSDGGQTWHRQ